MSASVRVRPRPSASVRVRPRPSASAEYIKPHRYSTRKHYNFFVSQIYHTKTLHLLCVTDIKKIISHLLISSHLLIFVLNNLQIMILMWHWNTNSGLQRSIDYRIYSIKRLGVYWFITACRQGVYSREASIRERRLFIKIWMSVMLVYRSWEGRYTSCIWLLFIVPAVGVLSYPLSYRQLCHKCNWIASGHVS